MRTTTLPAIPVEDLIARLVRVDAVGARATGPTRCRGGALRGGRPRRRARAGSIRRTGGAPCSCGRGAFVDALGDLEAPRPCCFEAGPDFDARAGAHADIVRPSQVGKGVGLAVGKPRPRSALVAFRARAAPYPDSAHRAEMLERRRPGRGRHRRGRPGLVGRTGHRRRGRSRRRAPLGRARLEAADARGARGRRAARARLGARHRRRAREPHRVRRARHDRSAAPRRAAARSCELAAQGFEPDRIVLDGKHDYLGDAAHRAHDRQGRPDGALGRGGVGGRQGHPRRDDGRGGRALPGLRLRVEPRAIPRRCTSARSPATGRRRSTGVRGSSWTTASGAASRATSASRGCSQC